MEVKGKKIGFVLTGSFCTFSKTIPKMKELKKAGADIIPIMSYNSYEFDNKILCGTRGWAIFDEDMDKKLVKRELIRLDLSLQDGVKKYGNEKEIIVFMHYPPITKASIISGEEAEFIQLMKKYNVKRCYYGHLHGPSIQDAIEGNIEGIDFKLVSADGLDFKLIKI